MNNYASVCYEAAEILGETANADVPNMGKVCECLGDLWGEALVQCHESARSAGLLFEAELPVQASMISRQALETAMWIRWASGKPNGGNIYVNNARGLHIAELAVYEKEMPDNQELKRIMHVLKADFNAVDMTGKPRGVEDLFRELTHNKSVNMQGVRNCLVRLNMAAHGDVPSIMRVTKDGIAQSAAVALSWSAVAMHEAISLVAAREEITFELMPSAADVQGRMNAALKILAKNSIS